MQCSHSFDWNWGKQNDPTACSDQLHPRFRVLQQGKCLSYPPEHMGGVTETPNCMGSEGAAPTSNPHQRGTPPLKFPILIIYTKGWAEKPSTFLPIFMGLSMTPITSIWSAS